MTNNLQRPVNASEREDCSWLGSDQGVFPAFFKMDSDFFTFQLLNKTVCPLCVAKRPDNSPLYVTKCHSSTQKLKLIYSGKKTVDETDTQSHACQKTRYNWSC